MKFKLIIRTLSTLPIFLFYTHHVLAQDAAKAKKDSVQAKKDNFLKELPDPATLKWKQNMALGDELFKMGRIYNGLRYYEEALNKNPAMTSIYFNLANGYWELRDYRTANKYFKLLVEMDSVKHEDFQSLYYYALSDKYLGNYERAKRNFTRFIQMAQGRHELDDRAKTAALEMQGCNLGIQMRNDKANKDLKLVLLDTNVNKTLSNFSPSLKDANTLYFGAWTSSDVALVGKKEKNSSYSRIYYSKKNGDKWNPSVLAPGAVNTVNFHVGNSTFTNDGRSMYYTQCVQDENVIVQIRCTIYKTTLGDSGWSVGKELDANVNAKGATNTEPALGKDENGDDVLYFVSDRGKGMGKDLYYAKINSDGSFGKAVSLGPTINTTGDEQSPFYDFQTGTLYFASNGHPTIGGLDIFKTKYVNGAWTEPENLGMPINSSADDWYYYWSAKDNTGFVVSNRPGGYGAMNETCCDDIYQLFKFHFGVKGTVLNEADHHAMPASISLLEGGSGDLIKTITSTDGNFFFDLEPGKSYKVSAAKDGFFTTSASVSTAGKEKSDTPSISLSMKKIEKNVVYKLNNIYYEFDKSDLTPASKIALDTLYQLLKDNPSIVIELSSHTDGKGNDKYNMELSQKRAESCVDYLVKEKGIAKDRIIAKGYGKTQPIAPNTNPDGSDNPEGRAMNRRTQFKVVGEVKN